MNHISEAAALRTRKPRGQGASRRGEILQAAKRLFLEEGYLQATMRRIAGMVGVSPTALYLHFADKEAILQAIAEDFFAELLVVLQRNAAAHAEPLPRLRAGLRAYVDFALERADEYRLTFQVREKSPAPPCPETENDADLSFAVLEHDVRQLMAAGLFRPGDPAMVAETIWVCLHGVTTAVIDVAPRMQFSADALIDSTIDTVLAGLSSPAGAPAPASG